jgi:hypothetical protein
LPFKAKGIKEREHDFSISDNESRMKTVPRKQFNTLDLQWVLSEGTNPMLYAIPKRLDMTNKLKTSDNYL